MKMYYVVSVDGSRIGPVSIDVLPSMLQRGQITPSSLCFTEGMTAWTPLCSAPIAPYLFSGSPGVAGGQVVARWGVLNSFLSAWRKFFVFSGRASRAEYVYFTLSSLAIFVLLGCVCFLWCSLLSENVTARETVASVFFAIFQLMMLAWLLPSLSLTVRRLHDTGNSGLMILLYFVPVVNAIFSIALPIWLFFKGSVGPNQYGVQADSPEN